MEGANPLSEVFHGGRETKWFAPSRADSSAVTCAVMHGLRREPNRDGRSSHDSHLWLARTRSVTPPAVRTDGEDPDLWDRNDGSPHPADALAWQPVPRALHPGDTAAFRVLAGQIGWEDFDRHLAVEARVVGGVDDPHAAVAEFGEDRVRAEGGT